MALLDLSVLGVSPVLFWPLVVGGLGLFFVVSKGFYNLFLHPLRNYPGPRLWAVSYIPYNLSFLSGKMPFIVSDLHEKYGDVVRVSPDRLSYTDPDAWRDIRGHRKSGQGENGKDPDFFFFSRHNVLGAGREKHTRFRRSLAHGFSAKTMQAQEPLIVQYVELLINRLRALASADNTDTKSSGGVVNLAAWFNFTTFDVIGDLAFGSPFGCLAESRYHPWVQAIFTSVRQFARVVILKRHAPAVLDFLTKHKIIGGGQAGQVNIAAEKVDERLSLTTDRPDFIDAMTKHADDGEGEALDPMTREEIIDNARIIVLAGSETTATALSGAAYFLATLPDVQRKLAEEVRSTFKSESEINIFGVQDLRYMLAVLDESMRMFPPVPTNLPRVCQPGGDTICGKFVPPGTGLDIWPPAMNYCTRNFPEPTKFIPERWLDDAEGNVTGKSLDKSRQHAFQPFSVGPRNCIGKNLAYVEMRLILARVIWNFDLALADPADEGRWIDDCKHFNLTLKGPLNIRLTPVKRG